MAENEKSSVEMPLPADEHVSPEQATTDISYCPHLDIYHYKRVDGSEYFFSEDQLEASIEAYCRQGDPRQAEFMALLTAWGRRFPHKLITIRSDGRVLVRDLPPRQDREETEVSSPDEDPAKGEK